ncbi:MAG: hypothetical protein DRP79_08085, partial [Planctomycetota bacterium]
GQRLHREMIQPCKGYSLAERELWRHSLAAAIAAGKISSFTRKPIPGSAFTAALMHDIGKLILTRYHDPEKISVINRMVEKGALYIEAERSVLGTDHAVVGGMMAKRWQFPESLVHAIEKHHDPDAESSPVLDTVHVANIVAKTLGIGLGSDQMNLTASTDAAERLGLSSKTLEALCAAVPDELSKTEALFEVRA